MVMFANAFLVCPYKGTSHKLIKSLDKIPQSNYDEIANISYVALDEQFYHSSCQPVLVCCDWTSERYENINNYYYETIPASVAVPLMLLKELPCHLSAELGEPWEHFKEFILGDPCGVSSSLFVGRKTGGVMKKIWEILLESKVFGETKGDGL